MISDVVPIALSKMIKYGPEGVKRVSKEFYVEFNFDYLDDTYTKYGYKELHNEDNIYDGEYFKDFELFRWKSTLFC